MSEFPPRDRLVQVASSLVRHLPEQYGELLAAPRFEEGRASIQRLTDPSALDQGAASMAPEEASCLADLLLERWALVGDVEIDPAAAIVGPEEVWTSRQPRTIVYDLATLGLEEGWSAQWTGDAQPSEDGRSATLTVYPPDGDQPASAKMTVRVMGRAEGKRCILTATRRVRFRRPVISLDESRLRLVVRDHTGEPAGGIEVEVGAQRYTTQPSGLLELEQDPGEGAVVKVEGVVVRHQV